MAVDQFEGIGNAMHGKHMGQQGTQPDRFDAGQSQSPLHQEGRFERLFMAHDQL